MHVWRGYVQRIEREDINRERRAEEARRGSNGKVVVVSNLLEQEQTSYIHKEPWRVDSSVSRLSIRYALSSCYNRFQNGLYKVEGLGIAGHIPTSRQQLEPDTSK
jgi:hypothetical protein